MNLTHPHRLVTLFGFAMVTLAAQGADVQMAQGGPGIPSSAYGQATPVDFSGEASAVLFYTGNEPRGEPDSLIEITQFYRSIGASAVEVIDVFPQDLSPYRLVFLLRPEAPFSQNQVDALADFIAGADGSPGRLVLVGEHTGFFDPLAAQTLLDALGVNIRFNDVAADPICSNLTRDFAADRLMKGIPLDTSIGYAYTDTFTLGEGAKKVLGTRSGAPMIAVYPAEREVLGDVVVFGDSNLLTDGCDPGRNLNRLWR
ncbi:MAG: hypothetical protein AAFX85_13780, partial [Pseudomonadota bacterium]